MPEDASGVSAAGEGDGGAQDMPNQALLKGGAGALVLLPSGDADEPVPDSRRSFGDKTMRFLNPGEGRPCSASPSASPTPPLRRSLDMLLGAGGGVLLSSSSPSRHVRSLWGKLGSGMKAPSHKAAASRSCDPPCVGSPSGQVGTSPERACSDDCSSGLNVAAPVLGAGHGSSSFENGSEATSDAMARAAATSPRGGPAAAGPGTSPRSDSFYSYSPAPSTVASPYASAGGCIADQTLDLRQVLAARCLGEAPSFVASLPKPPGVEDPCTPPKPNQPAAPTPDSQAAARSVEPTVALSELLKSGPAGTLANSSSGQLLQPLLGPAGGGESDGALLICSEDVQLQFAQPESAVQLAIGCRGSESEREESLPELQQLEQVPDAEREPEQQRASCQSPPTQQHSQEEQQQQQQEQQSEQPLPCDPHQQVQHHDGQTEQPSPASGPPRHETQQSSQQLEPQGQSQSSPPQALLPAEEHQARLQESPQCEERPAQTAVQSAAGSSKDGAASPPLAVCDAPSAAAVPADDEAPLPPLRLSQSPVALVRSSRSSGGGSFRRTSSPEVLSDASPAASDGAPAGSGSARASVSNSGPGGPPRGEASFEAESGCAAIAPALSVRESIPLFSLSGSSSAESSLLAAVGSREDEEFLSCGARQSFGRLMSGCAPRGLAAGRGGAFPAPQLAPVAEVSFNESPASSQASPFAPAQLSPSAVPMFNSAGSSERMRCGSAASPASAAASPLLPQQLAFSCSTGTAPPGSTPRMGGTELRKVPLPYGELVADPPLQASDFSAVAVSSPEPGSVLTPRAAAAKDAAVAAVISAAWRPDDPSPNSPAGGFAAASGSPTMALCGVAAFARGGALGRAAALPPSSPTVDLLDSACPSPSAIYFANLAGTPFAQAAAADLDAARHAPLLDNSPLDLRDIDTMLFKEDLDKVCANLQGASPGASSSRASPLPPPPVAAVVDRAPALAPPASEAAAPGGSVGDALMAAQLRVMTQNAACLERQLKQAQLESDQLRDQLATLEFEKTELLQQDEFERHARQFAEAQLAAVRLEASGLRQQATSHQQLLLEARSQLQNLQSQLDAEREASQERCAAQRAELEARITQAVSERDAALDRLNFQDVRLTTLTAAHAELNARAQQLSEQLAARDQELASLRCERDKARSQVERAVEQVCAASMAAEQAAASARDHATARAQAAAECDQLRLQCQRYKQRYKQKSEALLQAEARLADKEAEVAEVMAMCDTLLAAQEAAQTGSGT